MKDKVLKFLQGQGLCVLATAGKDGKPEAATVSYVVKDDFSLLINTDTTTRKYKNIEENDHVAVVVAAGEGANPNVQIDGTIEKLDDAAAAKAKEYTLKLHPEWKDYYESPTGVWYKIKPSWMRYSDFSGQPPDTEELTDF